MTARSQSRRIPKHGVHKPSGRGRVYLNGRYHYTGQHGTPEADESYRRIIAEWLTTGETPEARKPGNGSTVGKTARP